MTTPGEPERQNANVPIFYSPEELSQMEERDKLRGENKLKDENDWRLAVREGRRGDGRNVSTPESRRRDEAEAKRHRLSGYNACSPYHRF
jgi:hypothetical protein